MERHTQVVILFDNLQSTNEWPHVADVNHQTTTNTSNIQVWDNHLARAVCPF